MTAICKTCICPVMPPIRGDTTVPSMAYGMYPFCVTEDSANHNLLFRRSIGPGEKDKSQRLADAADSLQTIPAVASYNSTIGLTSAAPLHVRPGTLSVAWSVNRHDAATHMHVIPALLDWTRWARDTPWQKMRRMLQSSVDVSPNHPRHVRAAQVVEFVGLRARERGESEAVITSICQEALNQVGLGKLQAVLDPETGVLVDVNALP